MHVQANMLIGEHENGEIKSHSLYKLNYYPISFLFKVRVILKEIIFGFYKVLAFFLSRSFSLTKDSVSGLRR